MMSFKSTNKHGLNGLSYGSSDPDTTDNAYYNVFNRSNARVIGTSFATQSSGIITFTEEGTYKVTVNITAISDPSTSGNDRLTLGAFISKNDSVAYDSHNQRGAFGVIYIRNQNLDGVGGSCVLSDYVHFANTDTLRIKTLIDSNDNDQRFENIVPKNAVESHVHIVIEKVASGNVLAPY